MTYVMMRLDFTSLFHAD